MAHRLLPDGHSGQPFRHADDIDDASGRAILMSLSDLHFSDVSHKDARYVNVIAVTSGNPPSSTYRWIDLRERGVVSTLKFADDIKTFLESVRR